ncbi:MAG: murein biosynthesis integral membrane protein MurJ [Candidatus Magasanikbacteria bacterium RIFOXYD1_FULL_40_23]|uniref:Probable lipid II flippase MurJ n=1 Tax=Candidatus Magasanikbacteria bacterium RIFOXYD1_FULL_40_23 TaxID=1798705 RepID=A0A1F6PAM8_9BACT|nr:MAG: murein biosynthesis integral membrane protein MurJ [Candidatus Magasanikbacteria bacterium RIFOXYD1_FULL_40_23]
MLKILNGQSKSITGAAIIISGATLVSRLMGLARDRIFAHYFSAGPILDAYYAAFKIPDLIYNLLIIGALSAGFIPTFTKLFYQGEDKSSAWKLANNILNITAISLLVVSFFGIIFAPSLAPIIAPGFSKTSQDLVATLTRIMFGSTIMLGMSMVIGGMLQSLRTFFLYSLAPIFYNLGIIIGAVLLVPILGISGLAWGVVLGASLHFSLQAYSAYANGYRWKWYFNLKDKNTRLIGKLMIPRTLGLAISQLNLVIITMLASLLPVGSVTIFNFANNLQAVPIGIIGIPFALAVFPVLSAAASQNNIEEFIKNLSSTIRQILFLIIPCAIIILLLRAQIVRVIYGTGKFDWTATIHTADTLAFFALSLFAQALIPLLARAFYALSNTKTPFIIGIISELVGIIAALLLMQPLGVAGLALAFSIASILNLTILSITLRNTLKKIDGEKILSSFYRIILAAIPMAIAIQYAKYPLAKIFNQDYFFGILGQGLVASLIGLAIYGLICYLLRVPELLQIKDSLASRWLQTKNLPTTEPISNNE